MLLAVDFYCTTYGKYGLCLLRSEMVQRLSEYFSDLDITAPALSSPGAPAGVNHGGAATHNHRKIL